MMKVINMVNDKNYLEKLMFMFELVGIGLVFF